jgi:hypothetical protein
METVALALHGHIGKNKNLRPALVGIRKEQGEHLVTIEVEKGVVIFDDGTAQWLKQYQDALSKVKEWQEVADIARSHLESALGDSETAIYQGREVIKWTSVESRRFDVKRAREILPPQVVEMLETVAQSRRFSLVDNESR